MYAFLALYFLIYGSMNYYLFMRIRAAHTLTFNWSIGLGAVLGFMVLAPMLVRMIERQGAEWLARALAYICYTWFGLVFLFVSCGVLMEGYRLISSIARVSPPGPRAMLYLPAALALMIFIYGLTEAASPRIERVTITSAKLNPYKRRIIIAQISDLHVGLMTRQASIKSLVESVKAQKPDMVVSTGDLVDGLTADSHRLAELFRDMTPRYGMYAIPGNHEYYAGIGRSISFTEQAGFRMLRDEALALETFPMNIIGVDYDNSRMGEQPADKRPTELELTKQVDDYKFTLILKHLPEVGPEMAHAMDMQLSGHTHKGQIFPFGFLVKAAFPRLAGLYFLQEGAWLYVSRGTGTWGPPIRVFAPPEVTIIEVRPERIVMNEKF